MPRIDSLPVLPSSTNTDETVILQGGVLYRGTRGQIVNDVDVALQAQIASNDVDITNLTNQKLSLSGGVMTGALTLNGAPSADLHAATKLYVDGANNLSLDLAGTKTMTGGLDMGSNPINNVTDPTAAQDAATQNYVITTTAKTLEAYSPVATSAFPVTYGGAAITTGDRFRVSAAGTVDGATITLQIGDVLEALTNNPTDNAADWSITNANTVTSSETVAGIIETATNAEAVAKTATDRAIVASNLATGNFQASATFEGLIELATAAEFSTGTDTTRAITPSVFNTVQTDLQQFVGLESILLQSAGTWTVTRVSQGDYRSRHTAANDTTIIGIDITPFLRTTASRGFRLDSFDIIFANRVGADLFGS